MNTERMVASFSDIGQIALPTFAGLYSLKKKDYSGAGQIILAIVMNQVAVEILKRVFNVKRPKGGKHSFPSGHTSAAFVGAAFLQLKNKLPLTHPLVISSTICATLVGIARIYVRAHWTSDVLAGGALGVAAAWLVLPFCLHLPRIRLS